jgi:tetratricopeptide (TPR) repeat protein
MEQNLVIEQIDEEELLKKAENLKDNENWQEIIFLLRPYYQAGTLPIEGLKILGHSYSRNKDYDKAIVIYQDLSQRQPHEAMWLYCLAYQYRSKKNIQSAIEAYEKSLKIYPKWIKALAELSALYKEAGLIEKALKTCQDGIQVYKNMKPDHQKKFAAIYSKLCAIGAKLICSKKDRAESDINEAEHLYKESITADPQNADTWYRLGDFLLGKGKPDEAIQYLQKAESLAPKKEYIPHKIAQAYLKKDDPVQALKIYETIPPYKRTPYILHGMAECLIMKGELKEGACHLHIATQREPEKWYHHRDLGIVLAQLGDRDQAIGALEKANQLYKKENGKDFKKILSKIEELKEMPQKESIVFEKPGTSVTTISFGIITKYNSERGFGFIKDNSDGANIFFHISKVKNRTEQIDPAIGFHVKFVKGIGEKGPQASKVWIVLNN